MGLFNHWPYSNLHEMNLDWIIEEVHKLIEEYAALRSDYDTWQKDLNQAFEDLTEYVNTYFKNLDVDDAINEKLNIMATDGSLAELVAPLIPEIIIDWLNEHIAPTTPIVDASLSIPEAAADAKIVGDYIFPSLNGNIEVGPFIENSYVTTSGEIKEYEGWHRTDYIEIDPRYPVYITKFGTGSSGRYCSVYDENKNYIVSFALHSGENYRPFHPNSKYIILSDEDSVYYRINTHIGIYDNAIMKRNRKEDNLFPFYNWMNGTISSDGSVYNTYERIFSDKISVIPGAIAVESLNPNYMISISAFDENDALLGQSVYTDPQYELPHNTEYIRLVIKKEPTDFIYPNDVPDTDFYLHYVTKPYNHEAIEVMTYNIGGYHYGIDYGIPDAEYDEKIANYRNFLGGEYPEIMGLQEYSTVIRKSPEVRAELALWDRYYPYRYRTGSQTAIQSRFPVNDGGFHTMITSPERYYVDAYTVINGKLVYLLAVHLSPDQGGLNKRIAEMQEVKALLDQHEYAICFGDFNPYPGEEDQIYGIVTSAGYQIANYGDYGKFWTWSSNQDDFNHYDNPTGTVYYIDNIIVTPNIDILEVEPLNVYNYLTSDHIPIKAKLVIK